MRSFALINKTDKYKLRSLSALRCSCVSRWTFQVYFPLCVL